MVRIARSRWTTSSLGVLLLAGALLAATLMLLGTRPAEGAPVSWVYTELLGKPTDDSITINVIPPTTVDIYYEYGTTSGVYTDTTPTLTANGGDPHEVTISGLSANTHYFYRMRYENPSDPGVWEMRPEYSFWTARNQGEEFSFSVTSDVHSASCGGGSLYANTIGDINAERPDFNVDIGDLFIIDNPNNQGQVDTRYLADRSCLDDYAHSTALFPVIGNHENEEGWNFDDTFSLALASISARKRFLPTPSPADAPFYSGNEDTLAAIGGDQYREDYYAWEWGDALFVVLDPFQYTMQNPYGAVAGEGNDEIVGGDQWNWTHGEDQYNWFKTTLENSDATFKFVFSHNVTGGQLANSSGVDASYVRGGATAARYFEWGGYEADGTTRGITTKRTYMTESFHELMVDNNVTAYFHGHDHQYAYEVVDGVVYLEVPQAGTTSSGFSGIYNTSATDTNLPSGGHILMTIDPVAGTASAEYVRNASGPEHTWTVFAEGVEDDTPPVITLTGLNPQTIQAGTAYTELGANWTDNVDGSGSVALSDIDSSAVNVNALGSYTVYYNRQDSSGNDAVEVTRTVNVIDTTAPVISLTGSNPQTVPIGGPYTEQGATWTDNLDGNGSVALSDIDSSAVNVTVAGSYTVYYNHQDSEGNNAVQKTRTVNVTAAPDTTKPVITLNGSSSMVVPQGGTYVEPGATWTDDVDGGPYPVTNISGTVNTSVVGAYFITYNAKDAANNAADTVTRTVNVIAPGSDTTDPVVTLSGANPQLVGLGSAYTELGATWTDNIDGGPYAVTDIDASLVNTSLLGSYSVRYVAEDASGNSAAVLRTVQVVDFFTDDNSSIFEREINAIATAGITKGCNPPLNDRYCPDGLVTRGEAAAMFTRLLGLTVRSPNPFTDDDSSIFEADIEKAHAAGILRGCNPPLNTHVCPDAYITRGEMAAVFVRAFGLTATSGTNLFTDDDSSIFENDIDKLATAGVTKGCNPPVNDLFCPTANITRGQFAAFIARQLGL